MQHLWINKKNNSKLIVFFNGWGMNETPVSHLECEDFDVLMLNDYRNCDFDLSQFDFEKYSEKYLICWSMGVYASNLFKSDLVDFDKKVAINGTTKIIDNDFGIPKRIYTITVRLLDDDSCEKFIKNMFEGGELNPNITITRTLAELKEELIAIQKMKIVEELDFDLAILSDNDRIVPTKNLLNFWQNHTSVKLIQGTHCPFEKFKSWSELLC